MIGEALRLIRAYNDMTQSDLAPHIGVSQSYISDIENGNKMPSQEIVTKYAEFFDIPVSSIWFFGENLEQGVPKENLEAARSVISEVIINYLKIANRRRGKVA